MSALEESHHFARNRIKPRQIGAFEAIAVAASQCQVRQVGCAPVLFGNDVIDFEGEDRSLDRQAAILTAVARSLANCFSQGRRHGFAASDLPKRTSGLRAHRVTEPPHLQVTVQLAALGFREFSQSRLGRQLRYTNRVITENCLRRGFAPVEK